MGGLRWVWGSNIKPVGHTFSLQWSCNQILAQTHRTSQTIYCRLT